jgi:hypothetical protein
MRKIFSAYFAVIVWFYRRKGMVAEVTHGSCTDLPPSKHVYPDPPDYKKVRNYWKWLKNKLIAEGSQLVSATNQLKLPASGC